MRRYGRHAVARALRAWLLTSALVLLVGALQAEAGSVSISWTPPTTNDDGTPLTDLAGYRIYLGTSAPACGGTPFRTITSAQAVSTIVTGLTAGTMYFARVSAVDSSGNESACSAMASGAAHADFGVTPATAISFGNITTGQAVDRAFVVQNTSAASITGTATVAAPFSLVSGGSFTIAAGASQTVTIRFQPTTPGTFASNVVFTVGPDTVSRSVSGTGTASATVTLSVTRNGTGIGDVTSAPAGIACGATCSVSLAPDTSITLTATPANGSTFDGWSGACGGTGACTVTVSANTTAAATFTAAAAVQTPVPAATSLDPATATAGSGGLTITVNGSGFVASTQAQWDGETRPTTVVSATQLRFDVTASDLATAKSVPVSVITPALGGGASGTLTFTISTPPPVTGDIIVDNADAGVQDAAGGRTFTGRWCRSSATSPFGPNSLVSCGPRGRSRYRWTPLIQIAGDYDVYVWWARSPYRASRVPITVVSAGGTTTQLFNEQTGGGEWVLHGRYGFAAGAIGYVETSDANGAAGADAVRFVLASASLAASAPPGYFLNLGAAMTTASSTRLSSATGRDPRAAGSIRVLFHDHPPESAEECVDVRRSPLRCSAIDCNRDGLPTPFATSSVQHHLDISMTSKTPAHRLVHERITTGNDQEMPPQTETQRLSCTRVSATAASMKGCLLRQL